MTSINRRDFLKVLGAVTLSPLVHASPEVRQRTRKIYLKSVLIAGFEYYDGYDIFDQLAIGDELELRRQPENPYDNKAIEVYTHNGYKLGYIPRIDNPIPAAIADQKVAIGAEISGLRSPDEHYRPIKMRLYMIILDKGMDGI